MMLRFATIAVLLCFLIPVSGVNAANLPYSRDARLAKIARSLVAFREAKGPQVENLERYLASMAHGACRADDDSLVATCLEEHARRNCASMSGRAHSRCVAISDIIVTNQVNEKQFVSREERFALMQKSMAESFSAAYDKIVLRKYALVTTEFLLSQPDCAGSVNEDTACLARSIDDYCLKHADIRNLPWQGCASSIIWFLGTS
jgi:hypothetical protein